VVHTASALARAGASLDLLIPRNSRHPRRTPEAARRVLQAHFHADCGFGIRELPAPLGSAWFAADLTHAALAATAARRGRYALVHTRDLETAWLLWTLGRVVLLETYRPLTRESRVYRRMLLKAAARPNLLGVVSHSEYARSCYLEDGFPAEKIRAVHNGFDPAPFAVKRAPDQARREAGLPEGPTVVYAGRIAPFKRIDLLLDAAQQSPEVRWVFAGEKSSEEAKALVRRGQELPNVQFVGYQTGDRLALVLQAADILVIPPSADPLQQSGRTVLPIKVFQYLAAGRPILTGDLPDTAELLVHDRNAVRIRPDDPAALLHAVRELVRDPDRRARLGAAAERAAAGLTWDARAQALLAFMRERRASAA